MKYRPQKHEKPITSIVKLFTFTIEVYSDSILYLLAIDSGMIEVSRDRDLVKFEGSTESYAEYLKYCAANKRKINEEFMQRYSV